MTYYLYDALPIAKKLNSSYIELYELRSWIAIINSNLKNHFYRKDWLHDKPVKFTILNKITEDLYSIEKLLEKNDADIENNLTKSIEKIINKKNNLIEYLPENFTDIEYTNQSRETAEIQLAINKCAILLDCDYVTDSYHDIYNYLYHLYELLLIIAKFNHILIDGN